MSETELREKEDIECITLHPMSPFREAIERVRSGSSSMNAALIDEWILDKDSQYLAKVVSCLIHVEKHQGGYLAPPSSMMPLLP